MAQLMLKKAQSAQSTVNCNPEHVMTDKAGGLSNHELHASNQERTLANEALVSWARRFLACNPFYLVSAALLLYGIYRVSVDPAMGGHEVLQLCFNLSSLEVYEALLVLTAIFLARRLIWY